MQTKTGIWGREPVMYLTVLQAGLALAMGFGLDMDTQQMALVMAFAAAVLGFIARSQVSPVETLPTGGGDNREAA